MAERVGLARRPRRRIALIAASVVVAIGVVASLGWFLWWPTYRPSLKAGETYGVDVSAHQGEIDWDRVAADDISFAYIKATEGGDFTDAQFRRNWQEAARVGLKRGAYHFFTLCRPGAEQARHFLSIVPDDATLPPAVDLELAGNCKRRPAEPPLRWELAEFIRLVEAATEERLVLYVGDDFESRHPVRDALDRPLWHRRIFFRPDRDDWWVWQFTGWAHVDGIRGDADLNVMRQRP